METEELYLAWAKEMSAREMTLIASRLEMAASAQLLPPITTNDVLAGFPQGGFYWKVGKAVEKVEKDVEPEWTLALTPWADRIMTELPVRLEANIPLVYRGNVWFYTNVGTWITYSAPLIGLPIKSIVTRDVYTNMRRFPNVKIQLEEYDYGLDNWCMGDWRAPANDAFEAGDMQQAMNTCLASVYEDDPLDPKRPWSNDYRPFPPEEVASRSRSWAEVLGA